MNKLLVGIIAAAIIGTMAFMQPTEAQAWNCGPPVPPNTLIAINDKNIEDYICHMTFFEADPKWKLPIPGCDGCPPFNEFDHSIIEQVIINQFQTLVVSDKLDTLSDDVNSISEGRLVSDIIIISLLVTTLLIGAANLARKG